MFARVAVILSVTLANGTFASAIADTELCGGPAGTADERIAACTRVIRTGQRSPVETALALSNRAVDWSKKGEDKRAIEDFTAAIWLAPGDPISYAGRGISWGLMGDQDRAIADLTEAIRLNPQYALAYYNRGNSWRRKADHDRAISDLSEAIRLNPQMTDAYILRGAEFNFFRHDYDRAVDDGGTAIRLDPQRTAGYDIRARAWAAKGDNDRAINDWNEVIRLDPKLASAYYERGVARFFLGQFDEAATDTSESCRLQACAPHALIWRYLCGKRAGNSGWAKSELLRDSEKVDRGSWPGPVIELLLSRREPSVVLQAAATGDSASVSLKACEARFFLGEYHLLLGHLDEARATLKQAVEICPTGFDVDFLGRSHVLAAGAATELERLAP